MMRVTMLIHKRVCDDFDDAKIEKFVCNWVANKANRVVYSKSGNKKG